MDTTLNEHPVLLTAQAVRMEAFDLLAKNVIVLESKKPADAVEKLVGDLKGAYLRRINVRHRLVYQILEGEKVVKVLRLWTHYE